MISVLLVADNTRVPSIKDSARNRPNRQLNRVSIALRYGLLSLT